jgi:hypothetical protein
VTTFPVVTDPARGSKEDDVKRTRPRKIRATLRRRDGSCVRRLPMLDTDDFVFCLLTGCYYDRVPGTCTYVERFWPHHHQFIKEKVASTSGDPLDVFRAAAGLPVWINGGLF